MSFIIVVKKNFVCDICVKKREGKRERRGQSMSGKVLRDDVNPLIVTQLMVQEGLFHAWRGAIVQCYCNMC